MKHYYPLKEYAQTITDTGSIVLLIVSIGFAGCENWTAAIYLLGLSWTVSESIKRVGG